MLLFFGALDVVYAVSLIAPDATTLGGPLFVWLADIAPLWVWSAGWATVGLICLWQAFCRRDAIGYAAAILLKLAWGMVCLAGWLFGGVDRGYVSAVIWLGLAWAVVWNVAGWPEPGGGKGPAWTRPSSSR